MKTPQYYYEKFEYALKQESFISEPLKLYEPVQYMFSLGGKRIRPVLCLMASELYEQNCEKAINSAIAIEIFHNFTLVHDDIMDNSPIRRGKPTVFKKWNTDIAILSGDVMFAKAYEYIAKLETDNLKTILEIFTDTAIKVCEGQQFDLDYVTDQSVNINDYLKMITLKTAVMFGAALKIGAILSNAPTEETKHLYNFGLSTGIIFQLQDDMLDVFSDKAKFGKIIGADIIAGKKTFLFLKSLELLSPGDREEFYVLYTGKYLNNEKKIEHVKKVYHDLNIKKYTIDLMHKHHNDSLVYLEKCKGDTEIIVQIKELSESLLFRDV